MIERVLTENDQQASLFLQQRLKMGTQEQKYQIIDAIVDRAYPLMTNRFGNFLVQRCFEHGTPQQAEAIAIAMKGRTLQLSMDAFGCHVVQKAFDCVNESFKATMVHELLRRIPETVVHRCKTLKPPFLHTKSCFCRLVTDNTHSVQMLAMFGRNSSSCDGLTRRRKS